MPLSRRDALFTAAGLAVGCGGGWLLRGGRGSTATPDSPPAAADLAPHAPAAQEAIRQLIEGNARFAAGRPTQPADAKAVRESLVAGQHPFAVVLGCSDSRVSPEVLFDEGLGRLFVVRQAGNVADDDGLGSIE